MVIIIRRKKEGLEFKYWSKESRAILNSYGQVRETYPAKVPPGADEKLLAHIAKGVILRIREFAKKKNRKAGDKVYVIVKLREETGLAYHIINGLKDGGGGKETPVEIVANMVFTPAGYRTEIINLRKI